MSEGKTIRCWEARSCGLESGGAKAAKGGVCPAARTDAEKPCWQVMGTLGNGMVQDTSDKKTAECLRCEYYMNNGPHRDDPKAFAFKRAANLVRDYFRQSSQR